MQDIILLNIVNFLFATFIVLIFDNEDLTVREKIAIILSEVTLTTFISVISALMSLYL